MSIGIGIFASVVLVLVVYHKTFRKVFFWTAGIAAVGCGLFFGGVYLYGRYEAKKQAEQLTVVSSVPLPSPDSTPDSEKVTCDILLKYAPNDYIFDGLGHCSPKPHKTTREPKKEPTNFEVRVHDGSYVRDGQRQQGYVEYTCVNTDTGEIMPSYLQISPTWELRRELHSGLDFSESKQFADFDSADKYARSRIVNECKTWVSK